MSRIFGTDGVRGLANRVVTPELALALGLAAARVLTRTSGSRPRAVLGCDPRASGDFLAGALGSGMASAGVDVRNLGVLPTPAIAYLTGALDADLGVVISASHNPMQDNGIKFLTRGGHKLPDDVEDAIEAVLGEVWDRPLGSAVGRIALDSGQGAHDYVHHLTSTVPGSLDGLRILVDCANGAASVVGPQALRAAGAEVVVIHAEPDGSNINDQCGSTHPERLQAAVVESGADLGVAFDGDADRCLAVDHTGALVDGDQIMGALAIDLHQSGRLAHGTLVVTVMSNLGLLNAMRGAGIATVQTPVGDRYVLEAMRSGGYTLGGEQSGHVIFAEHATTGDGILTALQLASLTVRTGRSLTDLVARIPRLPQVLVNVAGVDRAGAQTDPEVLEAVAEARADLGEAGRVLLRPSGTEPLVRVMVEAATAQRASDTAQRLADIVKRRLTL